MEAVWACDDLFSDRHDGAGALHSYYDRLFRSLPNELFEAVCIDGCSRYKCYELLLAMVFITDDSKKTLPVALSKFVAPYNTNYSQMFAAIVIAIIPTIIVYCCFSNSIVEGLTQGAIKG